MGHHGEGTQRRTTNRILELRQVHDAVRPRFRPVQLVVRGEVVAGVGIGRPTKTEHGPAGRVRRKSRIEVVLLDTHLEHRRRRGEGPARDAGTSGGNQARAPQQVGGGGEVVEPRSVLEEGSCRRTAGGRAPRTVVVRKIVKAVEIAGTGPEVRRLGLVEQPGRTDRTGGDPRRQARRGPGQGFQLFRRRWFAVPIPGFRGVRVHPPQEDSRGTFHRAAQRLGRRPAQENGAVPGRGQVGHLDRHPRGRQRRGTPRRHHDPSDDSTGDTAHGIPLAKFDRHLRSLGNLRQACPSAAQRHRQGRFPEGHRLEQVGESPILAAGHHQRRETPRGVEAGGCLEASGQRLQRLGPRFRGTPEIRRAGQVDRQQGAVGDRVHRFTEDEHARTVRRAGLGVD